MVIRKPSLPTAPLTWADRNAIAVVVPDGPMPAAIHGIEVASWGTAPTDAAGWENLAAQDRVSEPPYHVPSGLKPAAGVVVREPDGRVWIVCPTNEFAGTRYAFPKGRPEGKSTQATALLETFEESGLHVRITQFLVDVSRGTTYTRYFLGVRVGGNPADMGWEMQAVMLVPEPQLGTVLTSSYDMQVIAALARTRA